MIHDVVIIGGGIVGLATAMRFKEKNPSLAVALVEKESGLARHQTGNNSGVIHSGLYYRPGSLKAINCIKGYRLLLEFCNREGIAHELCGKIVVATREEELPSMETLYERGIANGLDKIRKITAKEIRDFEPHATGIAGIWVPYTGIIDYIDVCAKYAEIFTSRLGGHIHLNNKVIDIQTGRDYTRVITGKQTLETRLVVNTAGLFCDEIAAINSGKIDYRIIPFRGEYYELVKEKHYLVKNLIYPVPDPAFPFLGVHYTRRIKGGIEAGPNAVFAFKKEGYKKTDFSLRDVSRALSWGGFRKVMLKYLKTGIGEYYRSYNKSAFTKALQRLVPDIQKQDLVPGGAGVRAQACDREGRLIDDFLIVESERIINVLNAPSPAATASLAIAETLSGLIESKLEQAG